MSAASGCCRGWWQLLRVANAPTAASNILAGFLLAGGGWQPLGTLAVLIVASLLIYLAGMVLNDVYDAQRDAVDRPERPIPAGHVSRKTAFLVGNGLLALGVVAAWVVALISESWAPAIAGLLLACSVLGYDFGLKRTALGPLVMGGCRLFNVLLGASATLQPGAIAGVLLFATVVGLYTTGLTYYARSENATHRTVDHGWGEVLIGGALLLLAGLPLVTGPIQGQLGLGASWYVCWSFVLAAALLARRKSLADRGVDAFRENVSRLIGTMILLDALAAFAAAGWPAALIVLSLLIPVRIASRWVAMT